MTTRLWKINIDQIGMTTSFLCAVHCLAVPFILSIGTAGLNWLEHPLIEGGLIFLAALIAGKSLLGSYWRIHGDSRPVWIAIFGFLFLIGSLFLPHEIAHFLAAIGGLLVAYAHYINWRRITLLEKAH